MHPQDCGPLRLSNPPAAGYAETDRVEVTGRVGSDATVAALKTTLATLTGSRALDLQLEQLNPALCAVLNALPSGAAGGFAISLGYGDSADPNPDGHYVTGQNPVIDLTLPDQPTGGYVSAVVVDGSGLVLHLLPSIHQPDGDLASLRAALGAEAKLRLAFPVAEAVRAEGDRPAFVVNAAGLGLAMVLVVQSEAPLGGSVGIEPVDDFVQRLKAAKLISVDQRMLRLTNP